MARFLKPRNLIIALVAVLALVAGGFAAPLLLRGPQVLSITPSDGGRDANPQAPLQIEFDQWVRAESLTTALRFEPTTEFSVAVDRNVVTVTPKTGLQYGADYRLTIAGVQNVLGRATDQDKTIQFATAPYVTVAEFGPANDATDVALNAPVLLDFQIPVVSAEQVSAAANDPRLNAELPQPLSFSPKLEGSGRWLSPTRYMFSPNEGWNAATNYEVALGPNLTSDGKARLEQTKIWRFTTSATLLTGTRPFDGAVDVAADGVVEVRLAKGVDAESARQNFTLVEEQGGNDVAGTVEVSNNILFFKPSKPLGRGLTYLATFGPGVKATSGAAINNAPLSWNFTVIGDLEVLQTFPTADASEVVTTTAQIGVRFNHPVVALTTTSGQGAQPTPLTITPPIKGVGRWLDTSTYIISPTEGLQPATEYRVEVPAGLKDQTGGSLQQPVSFRFTTLLPKVGDTIPTNSYPWAPSNEPLTIIFNQPMDINSLQGAVSLRNANGTVVPGSVGPTSKPAWYEVIENNEFRRVAGFPVLFTPNAPLDRGERYTLTVATSAQVANGSATLPNEFSATFTVAPLPRFEASSPANNADAVDPTIGLRLTFSAPMDWASVERNMTILPKPTEVMTGSDEVNFFPYFQINPETDYTITIGADARDREGVPLGQAVTLRFRTGPLQPALTIAGPSLSAYNAAVVAQVPLQVVNVTNVDYELYQIDTSQAMRLAADAEALRQFTPTDATLVKRESVALQIEANKQQIKTLDLGKLEAGTYVLSVNGGGRLERQVLAVSSYALTIKRSASKLFVWAVNLENGQPIANLALSARAFSYNTDPVTGQSVPSLTTPQALGTTDRDGVLHVDLNQKSSYEPIFIWSTAGEFTFATTTWSDGLDPWSFDLPGEIYQPPLVGNLTTDRPIYRPGQLVRIRGLARLNTAVGYSLPTIDSRIMLQISNPEGTTIYSSTLPLSAFGGFHADLPIQEGAPLGNYSMWAQLDGQQSEGGFFGNFQISEYRKPVFEVTVKPTTEDLLLGDKLEATVAARYFAGGVLANAPVRWRLLAEPFDFSAESAPGFRFTELDNAYDFYRWSTESVLTGRELLSEGQATTDAQGNFSVSLPVDLGKRGLSRQIWFDVDITDVDGQVISGQGIARLHAGAFYVGVRPDGYVAEAGKSQTISLITLDPQAQPVPNRALEVRLFEREWYSVREQGSDGRFYFTSAYTDTLVQTVPATTDAQGRTSVSVTPPKGGSYRIAVSGKDDAGRTIKTSAFTWAYGGDVFWGVNDSNRIDLIADKTSYKPGDTAKILVTAPYKDMQALLTIERNEVISHRLLTLNGTTGVVDLPITTDHAPNIYVSLVLIKPAGGDLSVPDVRMGLLNLPISLEQKTLNVTLTADKAQAGPRDQVTYTIKTTDVSGKGVPTELSLALVDKAVLSLADDANPTLLSSFYERRPLGVFTAQTITALADRVTLKLQPGAKGGAGLGGGRAGGMAADVLLRRNFPDTAYWNPALVTGDDGTAQVTVNLPDSLTTWTLTARGSTRDTLVGQASQELVATRPLYVRPSFPRFATVGDTLTLQAVVQNNTNAAIDATVNLLAEAQPGETVGLTFSGPTEQRVTVPANGQKVVQWPVEVPQAGMARIQLRVSGGGMEDALEHTLPVQRYATPDAVASAGQVLDQVIETMRVTPGTQGEIELELAPSLAAGLTGGLDYLDSAAYINTEQTVSQFLPTAVSYRVYQQAGVDNPALRDRLERNLATGLQRLYATQNLDGGWSWSGGDTSHPYLSAYVVQGLTEAVKAGRGVDLTVLNRATDYLKAALEDQLSNTKIAESGEDVWRMNARAYLLFVLSEAGQPDRGRSVALYEDRAKLDLYARGYLLMTLKALGDDQRVMVLANDLTSNAIMRPTDAHWEERSTDYWNMGSDVRTTAIALQALLRGEPNSVLVPNAVRYVMGLRNGGHWRSSQETATVLIALADYLSLSGELQANYTYRVALDDRTLRENAVNSANLSDPVNLVVVLTDLKQSGDSQLSIQRQATSGSGAAAGRLYYTMRLRTFEDAANAQPLDLGVAVQREYIAVNTNTLSPTGNLISEAKLGDIVQVRLTLSVPENMPYFVAEDWLPAGLEPIDTSLKTSSAAAQGPTLADDNSAWPDWWYFSRTEIRDNRVVLLATNLPRGTYTYTYLARATTVGSFRALPATAYRMYDPEVFGRSAGAKFNVVP
jgi:uncharacterized protein YfaS (alpha-2-macroglobulin family)